MSDWIDRRPPHGWRQPGWWPHLREALASVQGQSGSRHRNGGTGISRRNCCLRLVSACRIRPTPCWPRVRTEGEGWGWGWGWVCLCDCVCARDSERERECVCVCVCVWVWVGVSVMLDTLLAVAMSPRRHAVYVRRQAGPPKHAT